MTSIQEKDAQIEIERVDDLPVIYGLLERMGIQAIVDSAVKAHGNWQGLSPGWVITIWLMHILSEQNHLMEPVQAWVHGHLITLHGLTGQKVTELDFSDDRLALCLRHLYPVETWREVEEQLGVRLMRIYDLKGGLLRLDATVGTVSHDPEEHTLFQLGKAKNGLYGSQFKVMLASLDPLGLPLVVDVVPGNQADDPLYVPSYRRAKQIVGRCGLLVVGDSKMSALSTRGAIVEGQDFYLTPLAYLKDEPALLSELLAPWLADEQATTAVFLAEERASDGSPADAEQAIAYGFEVSRPRTAIVEGHAVSWSERLLVVRSLSYVKTMQEGLHRRLDRAEAALLDLTPSRQRGKRQVQDEASLRLAIEQIEKQYRVKGFFDLTYECQVRERQVRGYQGKPPRVERRVRYQLTVTRNPKAIGLAEAEAGWRIYATNAPVEQLSLSEAVLAYRDQYIEENVFRRLHGKALSITPLYIERDDHAQGLIHLLTLAARLLALGDYLAREALTEEGAELSGIYSGNPKRSTARPTTERMLKAFESIHLIIFPTGVQAVRLLSALSPVQERILALLGLSPSLYARLASA